MRTMGSAMGTLLGYLRPYRLMVSLLVAGLLVELGWAVVFGMSFQFILDEAIAKHNEAVLRTALIGLPAAALVSVAAAVGRDYLYARLGTDVLNDLRIRMFEHLQGLCANFYAKISAGDLLSRFSTDLAAVEQAVILAIPETVLGVLGVLVISVLLFFFSLPLALLTTLGMPLVLLGPKLLAPRAERHSYQVRAEEAGIATVVSENINAQPVVRAFSLGPAQVGAFRHQLRGFHRASLRFNLLAYLVERTPNVAFLLLQIAVLGVGAVQCFNGALTIGELCAFNILIGFLGAYVTSLTRVLPPLLDAAGGIKRIQELLDATPVVTEAADAEPLPTLTREIRFDDVSFSYDGKNRSLDRVSFRIPSGAHVAVVGGSGSGKSTVLQLLARFHDADSGTIAFDGADVRTATVESLRRQMGVVFQDSFLFNTTIRENIRLGRPHATDTEVETAARAAEIHDVIAALPDGYDTVCGERGGRLSGGQRQRVAIARAILRDPGVLLLDEATSALDPDTEAALNETLERLGRSRTVVSVTHRLASTVAADLILVMERGRLVESGSHAQLLARDGVFRRLWERQQGHAAATAATPTRTSLARHLRKATTMSSAQSPFTTAPRSEVWASPSLEIRTDGAGGLGVFAQASVEPGEVLVGLAHRFVTERDRHTIQLGDDLHQAFTNEMDDYVNHSCDPNAVLDFERLELVAVRPIAAGEEVSTNYLTFEWEMVEPFACRCGASRCLGEIRGFAHLDPDEQDELLPSASPYLCSRLADVRLDQGAAA